MWILAIDPGNVRSAYCEFDNGELVAFDTLDNRDMLFRIQHFGGEAVFIEMVASYGMAVGETVFETVYWIGRFAGMAAEVAGVHVDRVYRKDIKLHLCQSMRAKDGNIRQALIDRYGGEERAIRGRRCETCNGKGWVGRGRPPCDDCNATGWLVPRGPLFKMAGDEWAALAVGIYYLDTQEASNVDSVS